MSVKIARLRSGEDIISDIKEIHDEDNNLVAIRLEVPYMIGLEESIENMFSEDGTQKVSSPRVRFFPWTPLAKSQLIFVDPNEIICVYEPVEQIMLKYETIKEAVQHGGGNESSTGDTTTTVEASPIESSGPVSDWEGD